MPRNGSGIYSHPFPDVVEGTTIESAVFNGNTADVEQDLNTPRPIVAGGTGANNARDAMINLGGELSNQVVTNYDTFPFVAGSFRSAAGATGAPTGNDFAGICYLSGDTYVVLEARDWTTGKLYIRRKLAGVWGAWAEQIGGVVDLDARYVNVSGDAMSGILTASGLMATSAAVTSGSGGAVGTYYFGNTGTKTFTYDGTSYYLTGGPLLVTGPIYSVLTATTGAYNFGTSGTKYLHYDGTSFNLNGGNNLVINATASAPGIVFQTGGVTGWQFSVQNPPFYLLNAALTSGVQLATQAATSWSAYSDARLKENVETLSVLDMLTSFRAVRYTATLTGAVEIGIIAQEQIDTFPELITRGSDGELVEKTIQQPGIWAAAYDRFGPIALQGVKELYEIIKTQSTEIQALKTRLEALEAAP